MRDDTEDDTEDIDDGVACNDTAVGCICCENVQLFVVVVDKRLPGGFNMD